MIVHEGATIPIAPYLKSFFLDKHSQTYYSYTIMAVVANNILGVVLIDLARGCVACARNCPH
jgi:hypothetical protein